MLEYLAEQVDPRQAQLFICACCRHCLWDVLDEVGRRAVEVGERYALCRATKEELAAGYRSLHSHRIDVEDADELVWCVFWALEDDLHLSQQATEAYESVAFEARAKAGGPDRQELDGALADVLREVIGNPFQPVLVDPTWLRWNGGTVRRLAGEIDAEQRFADLPVLADALQDAGCTADALLDHLRSAGPHLPGCWALARLRWLN
jgi:hypothetical protein